MQCLTATHGSAAGKSKKARTHTDSGLSPHLRESLRCIDGLEQGESIGADRRGQPLPLVSVLGSR